MSYDSINREIGAIENQYIMSMEMLLDRLIYRIFDLHPKLTMFAITAGYTDPNEGNDDAERDFFQGILLQKSSDEVPDEEDLVSTTPAEILSTHEFSEWWDDSLLTALNGFVNMFNHKYTSDVFLLFTRAGQQYSLYAPEDLP